MRIREAQKHTDPDAEPMLYNFSVLFVWINIDQRLSWIWILIRIVRTDPDLCLTDPDADTGGPKTYGSYGSGCETNALQLFSVVCLDQH
jgi:hypothetical protein